MPGLFKVTLLLLPFILSCGRASVEILVEAESFQEKGGWVVDPQFVEQMGSPYLLAHGMGFPVKNAMTRVKLPEGGEYHVWVRTKNWADGNWEAPGRFRVVIDGMELGTDLGTGSGKWAWQYAGTAVAAGTDIIVELKDLTGFEGRCDAVYLSRGKNAPPDAPEMLSDWRRRVTGESLLPEKTASFDLVVVGGGIAGCAASIAAAEQGLKVALVHDRPVLGGNASSEIRVHTEGITWKSDRIISMLNTVWWPNGSPDAVSDDKKRHDNISRYHNISVFLNWRAFNTNTVNDSIISVDARHTSSGERMRFAAPLFIDCTGDGWIGYWAGAEYMYGREDSLQYNENWELHKELWSPAKPDGRVMGSSVLWRTKDTGNPVGFQEVPWALETAKDHSTMGTGCGSSPVTIYTS